MRLKDKRAIVTGAGSGFGAGIARKFAAEGALVLLADINHEAAEAQAREIGGRAAHVDVSDGGSMARMVAEARAAMGEIDILVNNAGVTHMPAPMEEIEEAEFDRVFAVNCKSVYLAARAVVPLMKARGSGVILNIASTAAVSPRPNLNWYNASKGWMTTATRAIPSAWAARAATATEEKRQKPMARSGSAWWPGGRTAQKALSASPAITASTAARTAPAARKAASPEAGEISVSPSIAA